MKIKSFPLLLLPLVAQAQYSGGNGRGDVSAFFQPAPIASNVFSGGNGRGDVAASFQPAPIASDIFSGGNGRGDVAMLFQPAPIASNIFGGGIGRGEIASLFQPTAIPSNIFAGGIGRGDVAVSFDPRQVLLALRGFLEGPYNSGTGEMGDALRTLGSFPLTEPYTLLGYAHVGGGGESLAPAVLTTTGNNAIVDWVVVELRDATTPTTVLDSRSALIQRDGDVVAVDGVSAVTFHKPPGDYRVSLRHRNHLGAMTLNSLALGATATPVDLTQGATLTYGTQARKSITGTFPAEALWAGDVTFNSQVQYTGAGNDRDPVLVVVGNTTANNVVSNTYSTRDVNLDGSVQYTGAGNDRDPILVNVGNTTPNNVRSAQLP